MKTKEEIEEAIRVLDVVAMTFLKHATTENAMQIVMVCEALKWAVGEESKFEKFITHTTPLMEILKAGNAENADN